MKISLILDGHTLDLDTFVEVTRHKRKITLSETALERVNESFATVGRIVESGVPTYGISTGFGELSRVTIKPEENETLQLNLIRSHASAVGEPLAEAEVRGMMLLRLNTMLKGFSGVNPAICRLLTELLNRNIVPYIPEKGSLGASGDLANLAHMALVLIGEGEAFVEGKKVAGIDALSKAGLSPVRLSGKDGLALINGTQLITSIGALALFDAFRLYETAAGSLSLTLEALRGITAAFLPEVHELRPHPGQIDTAALVLALVAGSDLTNSRPGDVQDAYSLRCAPQVHGAVLDALNTCRLAIEIEMNAVNDNPLVLRDGRILSGGHFHGEPLALPLDYAAIAVAELANIAERRIERMVNPQLSGLPAFLTPQSGLNSGYMIPQYVAAALVSENKVLAHPASVDSIPSSANKEDHVSMGSHAARKFSAIVKNAAYVLAIELMVAAQAIDLGKHTDEKLGRATNALYDLIRTHIPTLGDDRMPAGDIEALKVLTLDGAFARIVSDVREKTNEDQHR
jgi:histidine ammonia-lyase